MAKSPSRRKARELAIQILYGLNFSPAPDLEALEKVFRTTPREKEDENGGEAPGGFAWELVRGVWSRMSGLDGTINKYTRTWRADRLGKIELTILRLALYELLWLKDTPPGAIINEALELAAQFGNADAKPLINGILDAAMKSGDNVPESGQIS